MGMLVDMSSGTAELPVRNPQENNDAFSVVNN